MKVGEQVPAQQLDGSWSVDARRNPAASGTRVARREQQPGQSAISSAALEHFLEGFAGEAGDSCAAFGRKLLGFRSQLGGDA